MENFVWPQEDALELCLQLCRACWNFSFTTWDTPAGGANSLSLCPSCWTRKLFEKTGGSFPFWKFTFGEIQAEMSWQSVLWSCTKPGLPTPHRNSRWSLDDPHHKYSHLAPWQCINRMMTFSPFFFVGGAEEFKKFYTFFKQCELGSYQGLVRSSVHLLQRRCLPPWDTRVAHKQRINFRLRLDLATSDLFQCLRRLRLIPNWVLCNWFWFKIIITIPGQSFYSTNSSIEQSEDVRKLDAPSASNAALGRMAGNGMHLASAAFTALVSMICLTDKWFWFPLKTCMVPQRSVGVLWIHATCNDAIVYG